MGGGHADAHADAYAHSKDAPLRPFAKALPLTARRPST